MSRACSRRDKSSYGKKKVVKEQMNALPHFDQVAEEREMEQRNFDHTSKGKQDSSSQSVQSSFQQPKPPRQIGPLDIYYRKDADEICDERKRNCAKAFPYNDSRKEMRDYAVQKFARWMYDKALPFKVVNGDTIGPWVLAFGQFGPDMKPPMYHEMRVVYVKKEKEHTNNLLKCHEEEQVKYGCTIIVDGWSDKKGLINFLVNTPRGSRFIESLDVSNKSHSGEFISACWIELCRKLAIKMWFK